ncbi:hypothetical protein CIB84_017299 [Bambusicola thoracicus]|nr:hypothetical protein CIB84_017299 [Bambusicola thoracicus]
MFPQTYC